MALAVKSLALEAKSLALALEVKALALALTPLALALEFVALTPSLDQIDLRIPLRQGEAPPSFNIQWSVIN